MKSQAAIVPMAARTPVPRSRVDRRLFQTRLGRVAEPTADVRATAPATTAVGPPYRATSRAAFDNRVIGDGLGRRGGSGALSMAAHDAVGHGCGHRGRGRHGQDPLTGLRTLGCDPVGDGVGGHRDEQAGGAHGQVGQGVASLVVRRGGTDALGPPLQQPVLQPHRAEVARRGDSSQVHAGILARSGVDRTGDLPADAPDWRGDPGCGIADVPTWPFDHEHKARTALD